MSTAPDRRYRGVSASERQRRRREQLVDAALDLVGEVGLAAVTVDGVCDRAGLTKRYFYESFKDADTLFVELLGDLLDDVHAALVDALADDRLDVPARIEVTFELLVDQLLTDPRCARLYADAAARRAVHRRREQAYDTFCDLVLSDVFLVDVGDQSQRVRAMVVVAGVTDSVSLWLTGGFDLDRRGLVESLVRLGRAVAVA